ncbi:MAG: NTP transferase domain-containing protein [Candidatus Riflebacteria bacterium]|nr:NTP transferase domain-containing protein [Candidatus Riflebacteria bacterium]
MLSELHALILAAGKGTRMKSELPKVVHPILGRPMVSYVIDAVKAVGCGKTILVTGYKSDVVKASLQDLNDGSIDYTEQTEQLGTGHAVQCYVKTATNRPKDLLVVCGDTPLISVETLNKMVEIHNTQKPAITMMTLIMNEPGNYGRIVRSKDGNVIAIREAKDSSEEELKIKEINLGVYLFDSDFLFNNIFNLKPNNKQKEYYLTDMIEIAAQQGKKVIAVIEKDESSTLGINSRQHLAQVSTILQKQILNRLMDSGVTITCPEQTFIGPKVEIASDTVIEPGCMIYGDTVIDKNCVIGPNVKLNNAKVGKDTKLQYCIVENATIDCNSKIAPFTSLEG